MNAVSERRSSERELQSSHNLVLSAFVDGEGDLPESLFTTEGQRDWDTYHWIGDVLRSNDLARPMSADFQQRMQSALAAEPTVLAPQRRPVQKFVKRYAMPGVTLVVLVLAASWLMQPILQPIGAEGVQASAPAASNIYAVNDLRSNPILVDYYDVHRNVAGMSGATQVSYTPGHD